MSRYDPASPSPYRPRQWLESYTLRSIMAKLKMKMTNKDKKTICEPLYPFDVGTTPTNRQITAVMRLKILATDLIVLLPPRHALASLPFRTTCKIRTPRTIRKARQSKLRFWVFRKMIQWQSLETTTRSDCVHSTLPRSFLLSFSPFRFSQLRGPPFQANRFDQGSVHHL